MPCNILKCEYGCCYVPQRFVLCFMMVFAVMNAYFMRTCLNLAITEMVVNRQHDIKSECPGNMTSTIIESEGRYDWTEEQQQTILGIFFFGYVLTHPPAGFISDKLGGRHVFSQSIFISGVTTILTPVIINLGGWKALAASRFCIGCAQGALFPALSTLLAKWVPKKERSILGSLAMSAPQIGSVIGYYASAQMIAFFESWTVVFYFWGALALLWYVFFMIFCFSEPTTHPFITPTEAEFLEKEIGTTSKFKVPWCALIFDPACLAILAGAIGHDIMFFLLGTELPKYFKDVLKFNVEQSGVLNALPYLLLWIGSILSGLFATFMINKDILSVLNVRKITTTVASLVPSICLVLAGYMGCDKTPASAMFILGLAAMAPYYAGLRINMLDLSKNFCGIIQAYVNGGGALAFMPFPHLIALLAKHHTIAEWKIVFWIVFGIAQVTNVIYLIWASAERAAWDIVE